MNKIVITGSSGLIGSQLVKKLKTGLELILIDIVAPEYDIPRTCKYIKKDIRRLKTEDIEGANGIIHLAAVSRVIWGEESPLETWSVNVEGTQHLLNIAQTLENLNWFIYGSSREVYGEPNSSPTNEFQPLRPTNRYGISKLAAEGLIESFHNITNTPTICLRFSNVYGSLSDQMDRVIPKFILQAFRNETLNLEGSSNSFDFTHVSDSVNGICLGIKYLENIVDIKSINQISKMNICTGVKTSLEELANLIIKMTNSSSKTQKVSPRNFDVKHYCGDWNLAHKTLSYTPRISLKQGLAEFIQALQSSTLEVLH